MKRQSKEQNKKQAVFMKSMISKSFRDASQASIRDGFTFTIGEGVTNIQDPAFPDDKKRVLKILKVQILVAEMGVNHERVLQEFSYNFPVDVDVNEVKINAYTNLLTYLLHTSLLVLFNTASQLMTDEDLQKEAKSIILK